MEGRHCFAHLTIEENLMTGSYTRTSKAEIAANLEKVYNYFPRLKTRRTSQAAYTSGGEQQMCAIGRALMANPSMVLLDEPSEGVAPVIVEQMAHMILELKEQGVSILLSEQNMHFAELVSDRAYVLEKGQIRYQASMEELAANDEVRRAYLSV